MNDHSAAERLERALATGESDELAWALDLARREKSRAQSDAEFRRWAEREAEIKRILLG